jgi:hypothetical protein
MRLQVQTLFFNDSGRVLYSEPGSEAAWEILVLAPNQTTYYTQRSLTPEAARFVVRVRQFRRQPAFRGHLSHGLPADFDIFVGILGNSPIADILDVTVPAFSIVSQLDATKDLVPLIGPVFDQPQFGQLFVVLLRDGYFLLMLLRGNTAFKGADVNVDSCTSSADSCAAKARSP